MRPPVQPDMQVTHTDDRAWITLSVAAIAAVRQVAGRWHMRNVCTTTRTHQCGTTRPDGRKSMAAGHGTRSMLVARGPHKAASANVGDITAIQALNRETYWLNGLREGLLGHGQNMEEATQVDLLLHLISGCKLGNCQRKNGNDEQQHMRDKMAFDI
eukprot:6172838-Pleurochrysis_carterae.AAC.4